MSLSFILIVMIRWLLLTLLFHPSQLLLALDSFKSIHPSIPGLKDLHIIGLLPTGGNVHPVGAGMVPMFKFALEDIGTRKDILRGYRLVIHSYDTQVNLRQLL